jgi:hypothetical protein
MPKKFNYQQIQGIETNTNVTAEFIKNVEEIAARLKTKPEYLFAAISFETAGTFSPSILYSVNLVLGFEVFYDKKSSYR